MPLKPIGGFFELELWPGPHVYHAGAIALSNGRACLNLLLQTLKPQKVWVPFYTCDALLTPLQLLGIDYEFYALNAQFEVAEPPDLGPGEYLIYVNYFDLKAFYIESLQACYGAQLIVDNTQAFFRRGYAQAAAFNSARKFFGVPDGGYLYAPPSKRSDLIQPKVPAHLMENSAIHWDHLLLRWVGQQAPAYSAFVQSEQASTAEVQGMSRLSQMLLSQVDYGEVQQRRRQNFAHYHQQFAAINRFPVPDFADRNFADSTPFCYPLWLDHPSTIPSDHRSSDHRSSDHRSFDRPALFAQSIFVPMLWPDVLQRPQPGFELERAIATQLLPLPVDHRYQAAEIDRVITAITALL